MAETKTMSLGRTSNPALKQKVFTDAARMAVGAEPMTISGTVNKTGFLLLIVVAAAAFMWMKFVGTTDFAPAYPWMIGGAIGGLVVALVIVFKQTTAPYLSPVYALLEGVFLGTLSTFMEMRFPGIVLQAVGLTFGTLFLLLTLYKTGIIKATENFKLGVISATGAIMLLYVASFILGFFGINIGFIHDSGWLGIGFSVVVVVIAALNLVLDFDFIENGAEMGAPKYMEWYAAFGLLVTLVWLYLEILRLLSKLRSR